jgi:hypothetical protein
VQRTQQQTGPIVVGPPDLNHTRSVMELKKLVIQDLLGQPLAPGELWTIPNPLPNMYYGPSLNPANTVRSGPIVQFFEQVFEWENIVYICYPYFWGGQQNWLQDATYVSTNPSDPVFDQFLTAGSARVVVPARPGFENLVNYFLYTSQIWGGQNPPGPNDAGYLSVADEIQSIQVGATNGTPVAPPWEITLPTTFLWAGTDPTSLPTNANPTIGAPPPAIPPSLVSIALAPNNPSLVAGLTGQLFATGSYSDGSTQDITTSVTWLSASPTIAAVSDSGLVTASTHGSAAIIASFNWVTGSVTVTVN